MAASNTSELSATMKAEGNTPSDTIPSMNVLDYGGPEIWSTSRGLAVEGQDTMQR